LLVLRNIVVAILIEDVAFVLIDIFPFLALSTVLLVKACRSLKLCNLPLRLSSHLPLLFLFIDALNCR